VPDPASVRFRGPLLTYRDGFWTWLLERGYSPLTGMNLLRLAAHVSRWLEDGACAPSEFTSERIAEFVQHRQQQGYTGYLTPRAFRPMLGYLRGLGAVPLASLPAVDDTPVGRLLGRYESHLVQQRGIRPRTVNQYLRYVRRLLSGRGDADASTLTAAEIVSFVLSESRRKDGSYSRPPATAIRSLLRFLEHSGDIDAHLSGCVPAVAQWRLTSLPSILEPAQVQAMHAACDQTTTLGRRDRAILHLLVRLGLRAGEVGAMLLDDIDWRAGEILVHGKGGRESRMPLPRDVGQALAAYLRKDRPSSDDRSVFLGVRAPFRRLGAGGVVSTAARAVRRIGVKSGGAHLLRHTAASQLLRSGASLAEVGHVLRHRHIDTTAIYAKVDDASLRPLARPWPERRTQ
jgi:integrase/recombinase XerD